MTQIPNGNHLELKKTSNEDKDPPEIPASVDNFDQILDLIGSKSKYQKYLLYGVLTPLTIYVAFISSTEIFLFSQPDHWCRTENDLGESILRNVTELEIWKNTSLPLEEDSEGVMGFSKCKIYSEIENGSKIEESCPNGYEFDKTDFDETVATEFGWVCSKSHYPTTVFTISSIGSAFGAILSGHLTDKLGRKPMYLISIVIGYSLHLVLIMIPQYFTWYCILTFIKAFLPSSFGFTVSLIAIEISDKDYRAWILSFYWIIWVGGSAVLPLIAWLTRDWFSLAMIAYLPGIIFVLYYWSIYESPRFLLSVGRVEEAKENILKIAKFNGNSHRISPELLDKSMKKIIQDEEDSRKSKFTSTGFWTLFTQRKLAQNSVIMCLTLSINSLIYYGLTLNSTQMSGNQFLNFFFLSIIEIPSGILGGFLANKYGRRWPQLGSFFLSAIAFLIAIWGIKMNFPNSEVISLVLAKFTVNLSFLINAMQLCEIFPTVLRSTGEGLASTVASFFAIIGPYIIYTGKFNKTIPYWIFSALCIIGGVAASYIPETTGRKLPETIQEANDFSKNDKYWSWGPVKDEKKKEANL